MGSDVAEWWSEELPPHIPPAPLPLNIEACTSEKEGIKEGMPYIGGGGIIEGVGYMGMPPNIMDGCEA